MQTRPLYETDADRSREADVAKTFCEAHGLEAVKLGAKYGADFGVMRGRHLLGALEIKVRNREYPEMMLALTKCQGLRELAAWGLMVRAVFAMPSGIYAQPITCEVVPRQGGFHVEGNGYGAGWIGLGGRTDRDDPDDVEPVVYWQVASMKRVCGSKKEWFK